MRRISESRKLIILTGVCLLIILHQPRPAQSTDYITLKTPYCVFFFVEEDRYAAQRLADRATDIVDRILNDLGVAFPGEIKVYIADRERFQEINNLVS